jgi:hypothetical protein
MLHVEFEEADICPPCSHCGKSDRVLVRYVDDDGEPLAMFVARLSPHGTAPEVAVTVNLAEQQEGEPAPGETFALKLRARASNVEVSFVDDDFTSDDVDDGEPQPRGLSRSEALLHPRKRDVLDVVDAVIATDAELRRFFARPGYDA